MLTNNRSLQLFLSAFTARDIAEPLLSFDETTNSETIRNVAVRLEWDVIGVRKEGAIAGWIAREEVMAVQELKCFRPIEPAMVIADSAPLNVVIQNLKAHSILFVRVLGQVGGVICRHDLQKPAMRMWLFGLVTISEMRIVQMIDELCPQDTWMEFVSDGRMQKARELLEERRRRGQSPRLIDCLQFSDKGLIVARHEKLRKLTRFTSRRKVEDFVSSLESLRNNLAHSQDISQDWEVIHDLAVHLHRIVLGPDN